MTPLTYTPAAYWHRMEDEILEPRLTVTVTVTVTMVYSLVEEPVSTAERRCFDCKTMKPESQFRKRRRATDTLSSHCIDCHRAYQREYMRNKYRTDHAYRARAQAYQRAYQERRRAGLAEKREGRVNLDWRGVPFTEAVS